jgi:transglutaminase-like putative cysteine protease
METELSQKRWWDLPAFFLLLVIMTAASGRLVATTWTSNLFVVQTLTYLGLAAGLALGQSRFSTRIAGIFAIIYGAFAVPWRLGLTYAPGIPWTERLISLSGRLNIIIQHLVRKQAVPDSLLFLVLMSFLFWFLSIHAGYSLTRYASPWRIILPTGLALVVIHSYDAYLTQRLWYLVIYLFFALVLVARLVYLQNRNRWELTKTYTPPQLGSDFIRFTLISTAVLLLLTWAAPARAETIQAAAQAWQRVKQPWNEVRNNFDNAFASLRSSVGIVSDYYGANMALGRGNRLSDTVVFTVQTPTQSVPVGTRYYWKARAYDTYTNGEWSNIDVSNVNVSPDNFNLKIPQEPNRAQGEFSFAFTINSPIATLFTMGQPLWVSRPAKAELLYNPDGTVDLSALRASPTLSSGETYNIRASLSGVTQVQLREAGTNYPQWVTERYLELPPSITQRTIELAKQITAGLDTPYDKANAITNYLRNNIQYSATIADLPNNQDLIDWFLFDYKKGFCNYYATAEIVLLRAVGIPARMAVGYAEGQPQEINRQLFVVRQQDAHAWPEVYFPDTGWVPFEPTVSQPLLVVPSGENQSSTASGASGSQDSLNQIPTPDLVRRLPGSEGGSATSPNTGLYLALTGASLGILISLIALGYRKRVYEKLPLVPIVLENSFHRVGLKPPSVLRRWARRAALPPLSRAYLEINRALTRLGSQPSPNFTPAERAASLSKILPVAQPASQRLLTEYHAATYSLQPADLESARKAGAEIRSLSFRAKIQLILRGSKNIKNDNVKEDIYHSVRW